MPRACGLLAAAGAVVLGVSCGGAAPAAGPVAGAPAAGAAGAGAPDEMAVAPPPPASAPLAVRVEAGEAEQQLGPDGRKLAQLGLLAPKTQAALIKGQLWKPAAACDALDLVAVEPAPGLLVAKGAAPQVRVAVYAHLKEAGQLAKQRGTAVEVLAGHVSVSDAVAAWNKAILEAALAQAKAASPADRKEKSLVGAARRRVDLQADPAAWSGAGCAQGRLGGASVVVQLVALSAGGGRGAVLVKGGPDGDRFQKATYESTYWDKEKGKSYRMLTEIMSAGSFVRQCSDASRFTSMEGRDGTWRCMEGDESWEPPNRPLPAWQ